MTMHERVHEAGLEAAARVASAADPSKMAKPHADHTRDDIYAAARDPHSSWPEVPQDSEQFAQEMKRWLPEGTPLSPGRAKQAAKRHPRPGGRGAATASTDVVGGINQMVGEFNTSSPGGAAGSHTYSKGANVQGHHIS